MRSLRFKNFSVELDLKEIREEDCKTDSGGKYRCLPKKKKGYYYLKGWVSFQTSFCATSD